MELDIEFADFKRVRCQSSNLVIGFSLEKQKTSYKFRLLNQPQQQTLDIIKSWKKEMREFLVFKDSRAVLHIE